MNDNTHPVAIRSAWPGIEGAKYAGIAAGIDGQPDHHLILLADKPPRRMTWAEAMDWAESLGDGARLPTRFESALLYANLQDQFDTDFWHWTGTQSSSGNAWTQGFNHGYQCASSKAFEARARAVLRLPVQPFNPSTESISVIEAEDSPSVEGLMKLADDYARTYAFVEDTHKRPKARAAVYDYARRLATPESISVIEGGVQIIGGTV